MAAYLGPQRALSSLVEGPSHGLYVQSYAAQELETSVVSADGWGAAWYLKDEPEPCVYRSILPVWGDLNLRDLGRAARSHCLLAAVRSATDPLGIAARNTQPFKFEQLSFIHNGFIEGFRQSLRRKLVARLSNATYEHIAGDTDSEHIFGLIGEHWAMGADRPPSRRLCLAVREAVGAVRELAREHDRKVLLTLLVSDGVRLVATRVADNANSPSLYYKRSREAVWFASEPLEREEDGWQPVPDACLILTDTQGAFERQSL